MARGYDPRAADVWSFGVTLFVVVSNRAPFDSAAPDDAMYRAFVRATAAHTARDFIHAPWSSVWTEGGGDDEPVLRWRWSRSFSPALVHLLSGCLAVRPGERFSMEEVISHPWFSTPRWVPGQADTTAGQKAHGAAVAANKAATAAAAAAAAAAECAAQAALAAGKGGEPERTASSVPASFSRSASAMRATQPVPPGRAVSPLLPLASSRPAGVGPSSTGAGIPDGSRACAPIARQGMLPITEWRIVSTSVAITPLPQHAVCAVAGADSGLRGGTNWSSGRLSNAAAAAADEDFDDRSAPWPAGPNDEGRVHSITSATDSGCEDSGSLGLLTPAAHAAVRLGGQSTEHQVMAVGPAHVQTIRHQRETRKQLEGVADGDTGAHARMLPALSRSGAGQLQAAGAALASPLRPQGHSPSVQTAHAQCSPLPTHTGALELEATTPERTHAVPCQGVID